MKPNLCYCFPRGRRRDLHFFLWVARAHDVMDHLFSSQRDQRNMLYLTKEGCWSSFHDVGAALTRAWHVFGGGICVHFSWFVFRRKQAEKGLPYVEFSNATEGAPVRVGWVCCSCTGMILPRYYNTLLHVCGRFHRS